MRFSTSLFPRSFLALLLAACGFVAWTVYLRISHVEYVTAVDEWSVPVPAKETKSPTGYADQLRRLIVPEHNNRSYAWISETQEMRARDQWRLRHVEYDNVPFGRESHAPSLYRAWLVLIARTGQFFSGFSNGLGLERAALFSDPTLHFFLIIGAALFVGRSFGAAAGAWVAIGAATLFPLATEFIPGAPDPRSLGLVLAVGSTLPLLAGLRIRAAKNLERENARVRRYFFLGGLMGGLGLWISVADEVPIVAGVILGAATTAWWLRRDINPLTTAPWRLWSLTGCASTLLAYLLEYFPAHLSGQLRAVHPVYALAWLGAGELLSRLMARAQPGPPPARKAEIAGLVGGTLALATLPVLMCWGSSENFLASDPLASRLTNASALIARNLGDWLARDGFSGAVFATVLPLALVIAAAVGFFRGKNSADRAVLGAALGPVAVTFGFALFQLRWFNFFDATLLGLIAALAANRPRETKGGRGTPRLVGLAAGAVIALVSLTQSTPPFRRAALQTLSEVEVESVVGRDLAHWLARRTEGKAVVLASPDVTTGLIFHGGLRGLGTFDWENKSGLAAAVRIASASSPAEALALLQERGITHLVLPTWDTALEDYARLGSGSFDRSFMAALKQWMPLPWLRPLPYRYPPIGGFEGQSVVIFEVVDEQEEPVMLSQQAEYFLEMGKPELAVARRPQLQRFPGDLGALSALAQVDAARGDSASFEQTLQTLTSLVANGADQSLAWQRRVSLAVVLAQGNRLDLAREQVRRCLAEIDLERARSVTTGFLFHLLVLGKKFGIEIADPRTRDAVRQLLPPEANRRL